MAPSITEPEAKGPSVSYAEQVAAAKSLAATSLEGALQNLLSHEKTARLVRLALCRDSSALRQLHAACRFSPCYCVLTPHGPCRRLTWAGQLNW